MTLDELQKLIDENDIGKPQELRDKFGETFYRKEVVKPGYNKLVKYKRQFENWILSDFQKFIDEHPDITSPNYFYKNYPKIYHGLINKKKSWRS